MKNENNETVALNTFNLSQEEYKNNQPAIMWFDELDDDEQKSLLTWYNTNEQCLNLESLTDLFNDADNLSFSTCTECGNVVTTPNDVNWNNFQGVDSTSIHEWFGAHREFEEPKALGLICTDCRN